MQSTDRPQPLYDSDERGTLTSFLDWQRATLDWKCSGLSPENLTLRAAPPSTLSLLGIVRHMAEVENGWFSRVAGRPSRRIFVTDADDDADFNDVQPTANAVEVAFSAWRGEVDLAREVVGATELDATFNGRAGEQISLRWVLTHMIEEYARHNGHADLIREAIDGQTGE